MNMKNQKLLGKEVAVNRGKFGKEKGWVAFIDKTKGIAIKGEEDENILCLSKKELLRAGAHLCTKETILKIYREVYDDIIKGIKKGEVSIHHLVFYEDNSAEILFPTSNDFIYNFSEEMMQCPTEE